MVSSSWFRRHQKTVYIIMIFAMFVWGLSYSVMEMIPKKPIGRIFGRKITQNEFADMVGRWQRLFFSQAKDSIVSLVWKQLLYAEEAKKMGIAVTPPEVEDALQGMALQIFGGQANMDKNMLLQFLCNTFRLNQDQIDRTIREALLVEKLESMLRSSAKMTSEEAWQRFSMENEQVKIKALALKAKDFLDSIHVTEDEIRAYYEKYKNDDYHQDSGKPGYKLPDRVKLECIIAKVDDMEKQVDATEEELKKYYEDYKETQFKTPETESNAESASGSDGNDPKNEEKKPSASCKSFAEVKDEIKKTLVRRKAMEKAVEITNKADAEIYETMDKPDRPSFQYLAKKYGLTYEIPKGKKSGSEYLAENDLLEALPGTDQIAHIAFERDKYEPSTAIDFAEGKVVFQVVDKKPSAAAPFEEIRNEATNDLKLEKGLLKAREIAEKYAGAAAKVSFDDVVKSIKDECAQKDVVVCETDYLSRPIKLFDKESRYIEALKEDRPNVAKKAFELKTGQTGIAVEDSGEKACYVVNLVDRKPADKASFDNDKDNVTKRYLYEKQEAFMAEWHKEIGRHMEIYTKFQ